MTALTSNLDAYCSRGEHAPFEPPSASSAASLFLDLVSAQDCKLDESGCSGCAQLEHARRACSAGCEQLASEFGMLLAVCWLGYGVAIPHQALSVYRVDTCTL